MIECEVALELKPLDLLDYVVKFIDADDAREILTAIGFDQIPYQIGGRAILNEDLKTTHERQYRLNSEHRRKFNRMAFERAT